MPSALGEYMRTLVFEPDASGHRLHFAGLVAEALLDLGHDVLFVTSRAAPFTVSWREFMTPIAPSVSVETIDGAVHLTPMRSAIERSRWLAQWTHRHLPEHVYIPNGDQLTQIAAVNPSLRSTLRRVNPITETLILRPRFAYPAEGLVGRAPSGQQVGNRTGVQRHHGQARGVGRARPGREEHALAVR